MKFEQTRANAIEDFQCLRLGNKDPDRGKPGLTRSSSDVLQNAKDFRLQLSVFGLVDRFDESLQCFNEAYGKLFPKIIFESVGVDTTQSTSISLDELYGRITELIGSELLSEMIKRNQLDIQLYNYANYTTMRTATLMRIAISQPYLTKKHEEYALSACVYTTRL